ncbi:MAG: L-histidine N(alpha)-methyltransferase [Burkholderiales bacterium PBB1]|nr:MAG: L-histidine N(alpha)-methyltransferase [Burkholderiales bacterium PBB1]
MNPSAPRAATEAAPRLVQLHRRDPAEVRRELIEGLNAAQAATSPKFLYDALGSLLFEAITALPEYYPTRTEASILSAHATAIAQAVGTGGTLVDLGAGNCAKALRLIPSLQPERYVGVDISVDCLEQGLADVQHQHPQLEVLGLGLDFASTLALPTDTLRGRPVFFYPGSSIGNFTPEQAAVFLTSVRGQSRDGGLLIGVDLVKDSEWLEPAYDDALGVTAAFNLNLLRHLNRLIDSDFDPRDWRHVAYFNRSASRIEMHLEARRTLVVRLPQGERTFEAGERLHTENSYKYCIEGFAELLQSAGFTRSRCWVDAQSWFAVFWAQA